MITFHSDTTLQVVEEFNEKRDEIVKQSEETFKAGEVVDAEIIDGDEDAPFVTLEFGNGGVAFTVERDSFSILPDDKKA